MSDSISVPDLLAHAEGGEYGVVHPSTLLALVKAVGAAHKRHVEMAHCPLCGRWSTTKHHPGCPLSLFDFVGIDDQTISLETLLEDGVIVSIENERRALVEEDVLLTLVTVAEESNRIFYPMGRSA